MVSPTGARGNIGEDQSLREPAEDWSPLNLLSFPPALRNVIMHFIIV